MDLLISYVIGVLTPAIPLLIKAWWDDRNISTKERDQILDTMLMPKTDQLAEINKTLNKMLAIWQKETSKK